MNDRRNPFRPKPAPLARAALAPKPPLTPAPPSVPGWHWHGAYVRCRTDSIGYGTPDGRDPTKLVVDATHGFIPLWEANSTLRWRFHEASFADFFADPAAAKSEIESLMGEAILGWGDAAPVRFAKDEDAWDFQISMEPTDDCSSGGCVLAQAFFPDAGRHTLRIWPKMLAQVHAEQIETLQHELGHVFGLRHFFAALEESQWASEHFGGRSRFTIMNYGPDSRLTNADRADLRRLYAEVYSGQRTRINGTPIRLFRPYSVASPVTMRQLEDLRIAAWHGERELSLLEDPRLTFNAPGHAVVARVMEADLRDRAPEVLKKVQEILKKGKRSLDEAANYPDAIRNSHPETKPFHYVDIPFREGGQVDPPIPPAPNVISKIGEYAAALKDPKSSAQARVDALSWLFHLLGDIHQPMHCIERYSADNPGGDRGGNSFHLRGRFKSLHQLWDASTDADSTTKGSVVEEILETHPRQSLAGPLQESRVEEWARESHRIARLEAYGPLRENPENPPRPSAQYLENAIRIGRRQAALGGYRLADLLERVLGGPGKQPKLKTPQRRGKVSATRP